MRMRHKSWKIFIFEIFFDLFHNIGIFLIILPSLSLALLRTTHLQRSMLHWFFIVNGCDNPYRNGFIFPSRFRISYHSFSSWALTMIPFHPSSRCDLDLFGIKILTLLRIFLALAVYFNRSYFLPAEYLPCNRPNLPVGGLSGFFWG